MGVYDYENTGFGEVDQVSLDSILSKPIPKYVPPIGEPEPSSLVRRAIGDPAISLLKGAIGLPEAVVGLADIPTGGQAGKVLESVGYKPKEAKEILDTYYSPEQREANRKVQEAKGFIPSIGEALENPSVIAHSVLESAPSMIGGGGIARGVIKAAPKVAPLVAAAIGEGAISAGQSAEQIRQQTDDGTLSAKQAVIPAISGAATGLFGVVGGKVAKKLGIADVDTWLASGAVTPEAKKNVLLKIFEGVVSEGALEELPQSAQEQAAQNVATGKPWHEGVANAAALGMLTGGVMGGGANVLGHLTQRSGQVEDGEASLTEEAAAQPVPQPETPPAVPPIGATTANPMVNAARGPLSRALSVSGIDAAQAAAVPQVSPAPQDDLSAAKAWAQNEIRTNRRFELNKAVGESQNAHNQRILDSFRKATQPEQQQASVPPIGQASLDYGQVVDKYLPPQPAAAAPAETPGPSPEYKKAFTINPEKDDILKAMAKLGGLDRNQVQTEWGAVVTDQIKEMNRRAGGAAIRSKGLPIDRIAAALAEHGYLQADENGKVNTRDLEDAVGRAARGEQIFAFPGKENLSEKAVSRMEQEFIEGKGPQRSVSRAAAPAQGIGSLVAERRALAEKAHEAATSPKNELPEPTQAQIEAGNYKKGHLSLHGLDISIENPQGSMRRGISETGKKWETKLAHHYGYIKGTVGKDKDHLDVFVGPDPGSDRVFVVDQKNLKTGAFDEHKVMMGFKSPEEARSGYLASYDESGPERIGAITETDVPGFKRWLENGDQNREFSKSGPSPVVRSMAKQYAAKEKIDTSGWSDQDHADFAEAYRKFLKSKSRSAQPIQDIVSLIKERRDANALSKVQQKGGEEQEKMPDVREPDGTGQGNLAQESKPGGSAGENLGGINDLQQGEASKKAQVTAPQFKGAAEYPGSPEKLEVDKEVRLTAAQAQEVADHYDKGRITRLTHRDFFESGEDYGNPKYGHKFGFQSAPVRGITSFTIGGDDLIISVKEEAAAGDGVLYAVRPEDVGGEFVVVRKSADSVFLYSNSHVNTEKAEIIAHGLALKARDEALQKQAEGKVYVIEDFEEEQTVAEKTGPEISPETGEKEEAKADGSAKTGLKWDELSSEAQANATALAKAEGLEGYGWEQNRGFVTFNPDGSKFVREVQPGEFAKNTGEKESGKGKISPKKQLQEMVKAHYDSTEFVGPDQVAASKADLEKIKAFAEQHNLTVPPMVLGGLSMTTELLEKQKVMDQRKEKFAETRKTHIEKKLAATQDAKEKARLAKVLEGLRKKPAVAEETQAGIDEEIKNLSMADLSDMFDEVAAEVQMEQAPALDEKANRAARFRATQKKHIKDKLAKAQEAKQPKEVDRLKKALAKVGAGKSAEAEKAALEKPEKDNGKESFFKKGQRVQLADGTHGEVSDVNSYVMRSAILDIGRSGGIETTLRNEEVNHTYNVRGDNGVVKYTHFSEMFPETDPAPEVVPAPVYGNTPVDPAQLLRNIQGDKDTARHKQAAASRAKKKENIADHKRAQEMYEKQAAEKQAVFDAWAEKYPEEAAKYLPKVEPKTETAAAAPQASAAKMSLKETVHSKKGHKLFVVTMDERVERDVYERLNRDAKRTGNGYSAYRGHGAIPGFQFLDKSAAEEFMQRWGGAKEEKTSAPTNIENGPEQEPIRTASDILKEAASQGIEGIGEAVTGLYELFGGASLKSFPGGIDESTYQKAKPHFQAALEKFRSAGKGVKDFFRFLIEQFGPGIKPYSMRYVAELQGGTFEEKDVAKPAESGIISNENAANAKEEAGNELRGNVETTPEGSEAGRIEEPGGERGTGIDTGEGGRVLQQPGRGDNQADDEGPAGRPAVSGQGEANKPGPRRGKRTDEGGSARVLSVSPVNYRITDADNLGKGGAKQKARDNIAAIRTMKQILSEERAATPEEQAILVKYVGWGASELANSAFAKREYILKDGRYQWVESFKDGWEQIGTDLQGLLSPEEIQAASKSTLNAHYTSQAVINSMYRALERFGFTGGRILEPGTGIGNFIGLLPDKFQGDSRFTGVELDPTSAAIAKLLYPLHDIRRQGFEEFTMPNGFYDAAIGNPPFLDVAILSDPAYKKYKFKLHDYFFAKALDKVRPGGLLMFVSSRYTMDKVDDKARAYLAKQADLVGAIRLPQTAFKENAGTDVVTDVLFLRKRLEGEDPAGESWAGLKEIQTEDGPTYINEYFADHPDMVLGVNRLTSSQYRDDSYTVEPKGNIEEEFARAVETLPRDIYTKEKVDSPAQQNDLEYELAPSRIKEGGFYIGEKGELLTKENGVGVPAKKNKTDEALVRAFVPLRDAVRKVLYAQVKEGEDLEAAQKEMRRAYDLFVKKFGPINTEKRYTQTRNEKVIETVRTPNFSPLKSDPDSYLVASIEHYDRDTGKATRGPIFTERVINPQVEPQINSVTDALHVVMHETGRVDIEKIASVMGITEAQAAEALGDAVYRNPENNRWETDDEYLSGNVKQKLLVAEQAATADPQFTRNVEALKAVQPEDLPPSKIKLVLGNPIITPEMVKNFAKEIIGMGVDVAHTAQTGDWTVKAHSGYSTAAATADWGTNRKNAAELLDVALNSKSIRIYDIGEKDEKIFNADATNAALEKLGKINERFGKWLWEDPDRSVTLARAFNDKHNVMVKRNFGGEHVKTMTFPGMSSLKVPFEHQRRVAWRIIQTGNTYMAHSVGAGKTIASILAGMEMKRLGIKKKPLWCVPNHMLKQFASEFLELYPAAKIIVADEEQFSKENRNRFMGRVAAENWDGVIITHSAFKLIPMGGEFTAEYIEEQRQELLDIFESLDKDERLKRKQIERALAKLEQRLAAAMSNEGKDKGVSFEDSGIDMMFVDEAHEFRKLDFASNQGNLKGIDTSGSDMAFDLYVKSRYLEKNHPGRSLVLMSGTPITNTLAEVFTIQRFLQEPLLRRQGLHNFDAWAAQYGNLVTNLEATPAGNYKPITRFAKFKNLTVLSQDWAQVGDFVHAGNLTYLKRPDVRTGGRQLVAVKGTNLLKAYKKSLGDRIKAIEQRRRPPQKGDDILLTVITDGRHAAIDDRYINPSAKPNPESKLEKMIDNVHQIWQETKADKKTQMIFSDLGTPGSEGRRGFSPYLRIKERLIELGIPANEIAFMQDYKKSDEKLKLFSAMNEGKVRVLIGSSQAMGTGVNAQRLLVALHHLDPDNYLPSNIEQREGRIVRQGNLNDSVDLYVYVTKGSTDETMWQFLETKQKFIDQFLSGENEVDETGDIDGMANQYAFAKAMASDNPLILERAGIEADIQRLESLYRSHIDEQSRLQYEVSRSAGIIERNGEIIARLEKLLENRTDTAGDKFFITFDKNDYTERKEAGEAILAKAKALIKAGEEESWHVIGKIAGLNIQASVGQAFKKFYVNLRIGTAPDYSRTIGINPETESLKDIDPVGLAMRLENRARDFDSELAETRNGLLAAEKRIKDGKSRLGRPFEHQSALDEKLQRLAEINKELQGEEKAPVVEGEAKFAAKSPGIKSGIKSSEITDSLSPILKNWANAPQIEVVQSASELPVGVRFQMARQELDPSQVQAAFHGGGVTLVADNLASVDEAQRKVLHEVVGHYGLQGIMDEKTYKRTMGEAALWYANKKNAEWKDMAKAYGFDLKSAEGRIAAAEEMLAHEAESGAKSSILDRVVAAIRQALRQIGFELEMTDAEIRELLARARRFVEGKSPRPPFAKGGQSEARGDLFPQFAAAWHGSPHDFEMFSKDKIGTGEGNQSFGYGLYFASRKAIAEHYKETLSRRNKNWAKIASDSANRAEKDYARFKAEYPELAKEFEFQVGENAPRHVSDREMAVEFSNLVYHNSVGTAHQYTDSDIQQQIKDTGFERTPEPPEESPPGRLYHVELAPEEDSYLNWDKPLSDDHVALLRNDFLNMGHPEVSGVVGDLIEEVDEASTPTGEETYRRIASQIGEPEASEYLHSLGIRGIKYLDASSRNLPLREIKKSFLDALPEDATFDDVTDMIGTGQFTPEQEAFLKALEADDWLGFDYPAQAISAALSNDINGYDPSSALRDAIKNLEGGQTYNYVIFSDDDVEIKAKFALRRHAENLRAAVSEAAANTKMADVGRFFNPFDWSRSREWMEDHTPENLQRAVAWLFRNPVFQAEADPLKRVFVDAGGERSVNRMQLMLDFFGWKPGEGTGEKGDRTVVDKVRDIFSWANGDLSTAWGKIQDDLKKLTPQQRTMLDKLFVEGDRKERVYTKLSGALKNHRLQGLDQATFDLYKKVRDHIDGYVSEVRLKAIERMMREGGLSREEIAKHISDYRKHFAEREGWLTRSHGEGEHVVKGYRIVKELNWDTRIITGGSQATLRFYPGVEVMKEISALAEKHGAEVKVSPRRTETMVVNPGAVVVTKHHGGSLDAFLAEAALIVPDIEARTGKLPRVLVYNRFVSTKAAARKLAALVESKPAAHMPLYAVKGEEFIVEPGHADKLSESMYSDMKNDFAVEAAQMKSAERMLKAGEMSREEFEQFKQELIRSTAEVLLGRAAGRYQIRRAPYIIEGYDKENVLDLYQDYMTGVAGMISKAQYAKGQFDNFRRAKADVKPWAEGYIKDSLRNMGIADRWSGNLRSFASLWYMGARPASALINSTQIWTLGQAELSRYTKSPVKTILAAQKSILSGDLSQEEKDIFNTAIYQLQEKETAMAEISGHGEGFTGRFSKGFHMVTDKAMALFQKVEVNNRKAMLLAAYRVFREQGVRPDQALQKAVDVNNAVNFDMGRENLPGFARNPAGRTLYALQSFAWNSFNWVYNRSTSGEKKDMIALARYMGSILVIGGMAALPGGDELDKLLQKILGKSYQMEFKSWMKSHAHEYGAVGDAVHAFAWHGVPGTMGINISNALKQQIPLVSQLLRGEGVTESALGVFGGVIQKAEMTGKYLNRGMYGRAAESALPEGIAGPMRAARMYEEGVTTSHGKPVFDEKGRPVHYTAAEAGARALGLQPLEQSERTQLQVTASKLRAKWNGERQDLLDAMRAADTPEQRKAVTRDIIKWNQRLFNSQVKGVVLPIKADTIKNALKAKPDKKQMAWMNANA